MQSKINFVKEKRISLSSSFNVPDVNVSNNNKTEGKMYVLR